MKVLGILGAHNPNGLTGKMLAEVLRGAADQGCETETLFLLDYQILPDNGEKNPTLDLLVEKIIESDCIVLASPTYWGGVSGVMKNLLDCLRRRMIRMNKHGENLSLLTNEFKGKKYITITSCFASPVENFVTNITGKTFAGMDKPLQTAGMERIGELLLAGTFKNYAIPDKKMNECYQMGKKIPSKVTKQRFTLYRYIQLFFMLALSCLIAMGVQLLMLHWWPALDNFIGRYVSFVVIFFVLLAFVLSYATDKLHRRI